MKSITRALISAAITVAFSFSSITYADTSKELTAELVRTMGYGNAIHSFKNYVLRGQEKHRQAADANFTSALEILTKLKAAGADATTVDAISGVVGKYKDSLSSIKSMVAAKKTAKEIDSAVKISDSPATKGIAALRKGKEWSALENIEYTLGYGNAIHKFKNCVLRGNQGDKGKNNCDKAEKMFTDVEAMLANVNAEAGAKIKKTIVAYKTSASKVKELIASGKTPEEVDSTVKISDGPAKEGLAELRK